MNINLVINDTATPLLTGIEQRMADLTVPIGEALEVGLLDARTNVETEGGLVGGWAPQHFLTPLIAQLFGKEITGETLIGLIPSLTKGGDGNYFAAGATEGETGTTHRGAIFANRGTSRTFHILDFIHSGGKVRKFSVPGEPEREIFPMGEDRLPLYQQPFLDWIMGQEGGGNA